MPRCRFLFALLLLVGCTDAPPPNVILIVADDLGWSDVGFQGSTFYQTPHLDRLAANGVRFTQAYANAPNCAPSRASLMTGQYTPRHGIFTVGDPWRGPHASRKLAPPDNKTTLDLHVQTLGEVFSDAGYQTAQMGKWHLGKPGEAGPQEQGFAINVAGTEVGHPPSYFSPYRIPTLPDGPDGEYLTDRLTEEAEAFIGANAHQPFFLYLPHYAVHTPLQAPDTTVQHYADQPPWHGQDHTTYAAMIEHLDRSVGRILTQVEQQGLSENTLVVFFSDNGGLGGYASSGLEGSRKVTDNYPLKGGKGQLYEGGIRVPLVMTWPGTLAAGATRTTPVIGSDLYPTLLDMVGIPTPADHLLDGISLMPLLEDAGAHLERERLFWYFPAYLQAYGRAGVRTAPVAAVREGDLKLIWFFEDDQFALYDLGGDPGERHDLAASRPEAVQRLHQVLEDWLSATQAPRPVLNPLATE